MEIKINVSEESLNKFRERGLTDEQIEILLAKFFDVCNDPDFFEDWIGDLILMAENNGTENWWEI